MTVQGPFVPKWASPPGDTIWDLLLERNLTVDMLADEMGVGAERVRSMLVGEERISIDLARRLVGSVGGSIQFWLARDGQYRDDLLRLAADAWAQTMPISDLVEFGWIEERPATWLDRITSSLEFFHVSTLDAWNRLYGSEVENAKFRMATTAAVNRTAVAAWLRKAELEAKLASLGPWDRAGFRASLDQARDLTTDRNPARFVPELVALCADHGVSLVVLRTPGGCPASGASRYLDGHPQIVLSARYRTDDHFWFSFFHEAAHLVLHDRSAVFIDEFFQSPDEGAVSAEERGADDFAGERLIPADARSEFNRLRPLPRDIIAFARASGTSPGVIVGQLQSSGRLGWGTRLNGLKRRYRWHGSTLERA